MILTIEMLFIIVLFLSLLIASFFGHAVHWMIHQRWSGRLHRSHMDHHLKQYPPHDLLSEKYRNAVWYNSGPLLFLPAFLLVLSGINGALWLLSVPVWVFATFNIVLMTFAVVNDYIHDVMHIKGHPLERFNWFQSLRATHFAHHFNMKRNFGIVNFVWDRLFGTYVKR